MANSSFRSTNFQFLSGATSNVLATATAAKLAFTADAGDVVLSGVGTPVAGTDATNKTYVDAVSQGLKFHTACRLATVVNIQLTTPTVTSVDGVTLADTDRVLVKEQTDPIENGIYTYNLAGTNMVRAADMPIGFDANAAAVFVTAGLTLSGEGFVVTSVNPITNTDAMNWSQFSAPTPITAGANLTKTNNELALYTSVGDGTGSNAPLTSLTSALLTSTGTIGADGIISGLSFTATSDRTKKKNIVLIKEDDDVLDQVEAVYYQWKDSDDAGVHAGVIAQDVQKVAPGCVHTAKDGSLSVDYNHMTGLLIARTKRMASDMEDLKEEVRAMKRKTVSEK